MVLGAILATILGSKSHPKLDEKIKQILDRFLMGFGSQFGSILGQFWLQKSIKNQGRKKIDFWRMYGDSWSESGVPGGAQGGPNLSQNLDRQGHINV